MKPVAKLIKRLDLLDWFCILIGIGASIGLCRAIGDPWLSIAVSVALAALIWSVGKEADREWERMRDDMLKQACAFELEDPRHPLNPANHFHPQEQAQPQPRGVQVLPNGNVLLHSHPEHYLSPFSRN